MTARSQLLPTLLVVVVVAGLLGAHDTATALGFGPMQKSPPFVNGNAHAFRNININDSSNNNSSSNNKYSLLDHGSISNSSSYEQQHIRDLLKKVCEELINRAGTSQSSPSLENFVKKCKDLEQHEASHGFGNQKAFGEAQKSHQLNEGQKVDNKVVKLMDSLQSNNTGGQDTGVLLNKKQDTKVKGEQKQGLLLDGLQSKVKDVKDKDEKKQGYVLSDPKSKTQDVKGTGKNERNEESLISSESVVRHNQVNRTNESIVDQIKFKLEEIKAQAEQNDRYLLNMEKQDAKSKSEESNDAFLGDLQKKTQERRKKKKKNNGNRRSEAYQEGEDMDGIKTKLRDLKGSMDKVKSGLQGMKGMISSEENAGYEEQEKSKKQPCEEKSKSLLDLFDMKSTFKKMKEMIGGKHKKNRQQQQQQQQQRQRTNYARPESEIYYIRLPPVPYSYVDGLGYISRPPTFSPMSLAAAPPVPQYDYRPLYATSGNLPHYQHEHHQEPSAYPAQQPQYHQPQQPAYTLSDSHKPQRPYSLIDVAAEAVFHNHQEHQPAHVTLEPEFHEHQSEPAHVLTETEYNDHHQPQSELVLPETEYQKHQQPEPVFAPEPQFHQEHEHEHQLEPAVVLETDFHQEHEHEHEHQLKPEIALKTDFHQEHEHEHQPEPAYVPGLPFHQEHEQPLYVPETHPEYDQEPHHHHHHHEPTSITEPSEYQPQPHQQLQLQSQYHHHDDDDDEEQPFIRVPVEFVSNGRPTGVYQPAALPPHPHFPPPQASLPHTEDDLIPEQPQQHFDHDREPNQQNRLDSPIIKLNRGPYLFNGKPGKVFKMKASKRLPSARDSV